MAYVRIGGSDLYSETAGAGEPVLLLHGGFCSLEAMRPQFDAIAAEHRVFAFERPGHGRSADVDAPYGYARSVTEAIAYLDAQGLESAHVVGYSDGAIIALLLALQHPGRVRSLVAISANLDPAGFTTSPEAQPALLLGPPRTAPAARPDEERRHYERLSPDGPDHADAVLAKLFTLWTTEPHVDPAALAAIDTPALIVAADRDSIRPEHSLLIAASIPGAQLAIVPGATHGLVAEKPGLVSALITDFLASVRAGG